MHPKDVITGLVFRNEVIGKRQTYYVYEGAEHYVLVTFNKAKNTYNFNAVSEEACKYVHKLFGGASKVTAVEVLEKSKKPALIKSRFDALNVLYALCAIGEAKIDARYKGTTLFFNIHRFQG